MAKTCYIVRLIETRNLILLSSQQERQPQRGGSWT
jgi:hypothetical protein